MAILPTMEILTMARFSVTERNQYTIDQLNTEWASGEELTAQEMRESMSAYLNERDRHLPNVSESSGTMYLIGSNPDNLFDMTLLEEGQAGGIVINGEETGYQLVPIVTGSGINQTNPTSGVYVNSNPFDGITEVEGGSGATDNMLCINYKGYWDLVASIKPAPDGSQSNREVEIDIIVFDSSGNPLRAIGFVASANQSTGGRAFTQSIPRLTLSPDFLDIGEHVGLGIRKFTGEAPTTVRVTKCFLQVTLNALGE